MQWVAVNQLSQLFSILLHALVLDQGVNVSFVILDSLTNIKVAQDTHLTDQVDQGFNLTVRLGFNRKQCLTELVLELIAKILVFVWEYLQHS